MVKSIAAVFLRRWSCCLVKLFVKQREGAPAPRGSARNYRKAPNRAKRAGAPRRWWSGRCARAARRRRRAAWRAFFHRGRHLGKRSALEVGSTRRARKKRVARDEHRQAAGMVAELRTHRRQIEPFVCPGSRRPSTPWRRRAQRRRSRRGDRPCRARGSPAGPPQPPLDQRSIRLRGDDLQAPVASRSSAAAPM